MADVERPEDVVGRRRTYYKALDTDEQAPKEVWPERVQASRKEMLGAPRQGCSRP